MPRTFSCQPVLCAKLTGWKESALMQSEMHKQVFLFLSSFTVVYVANCVDTIQVFFEDVASHAKVKVSQLHTTCK